MSKGIASRGERARRLLKKAYKHVLRQNKIKKLSKGRTPVKARRVKPRSRGSRLA